MCSLVVRLNLGLLFFTFCYNFNWYSIAEFCFPRVKSSKHSLLLLQCFHRNLKLSKLKNYFFELSEFFFNDTKGGFCIISTEHLCTSRNEIFFTFSLKSLEVKTTAIAVTSFPHQCFFFLKYYEVQILENYCWSKSINIWNFVWTLAFFGDEDKFHSAS